jgi:hypothetical protein
MKAPEDLHLSTEQGDALIERLEHDRCTPEDRQILVQVLRLYFWLLFALQESKLSLKRLRILLFGKPKTKKPRQRVSDSDGDSTTSGGAQEGGHADAHQGEPADAATAESSEAGKTDGERVEGDKRPGHGRGQPSDVTWALMPIWGQSPSSAVTRNSPLAIVAPFAATAPCISYRQADPFASTAMPRSRPSAMR